MPIKPAPRRLGQEDLCEFEACLKKSERAAGEMLSEQSTFSPSIKP